MEVARKGAPRKLKRPGHMELGVKMKMKVGKLKKLNWNVQIGSGDLVNLNVEIRRKRIVGLLVNVNFHLFTRMSLIIIVLKPTV